MLVPREGRGMVRGAIAPLSENSGPPARSKKNFLSAFRNSQGIQDPLLQIENTISHYFIKIVRFQY